MKELSFCNHKNFLWTVSCPDVTYTAKK